MPMHEINRSFSKVDPFRTCSGCRVAEDLRGVFLPLTQAAAIMGSGGSTVRQVEEQSLGVNMLGLPKSQLVEVDRQLPALNNISNVIDAASRMAYQNCTQARASDTCPQKVTEEYVKYPDIPTFSVISAHSGVPPMYEQSKGNDGLLESGSSFQL